MKRSSWFIIDENVCPPPRSQALCWSTLSSWWSCSAVTRSRAWTKWSTGWTPSAGCWSSWWHCAWWRTAPGSRCSGSGAGWAPPSLSSTRTLTFGSELSLAGGASCWGRKQLRRSTPSREPQLSSCSSTTTSVPSASRLVTQWLCHGQVISVLLGWGQTNKKYFIIQSPILKLTYDNRV